MSISATHNMHVSGPAHTFNFKQKWSFWKKVTFEKITLLVLTKVAGSNPATAKIPLFTIIQSFEIVAY